MNRNGGDRPRSGILDLVQESDHAALEDLLNSDRIVRIVNRYFRTLDEKNFDESHFREIFTPDGKIVRPNGVAVTGPANIAHSHAESFGRFVSTQHLLTGHDVAIDNDKAVVRANLVAIHLWKDKPADASMMERSFTAGGVITADLVRVDGSWKMSEIANRIIWRTGHFGNMAQTK